MGGGQGAKSLKELLGEQDANYYLRLTQNGLAKQNLNAEELIKFASLDLRPLTNKEIGKITNFVAERGFNDNLLEKAVGRLCKAFKLRLLQRLALRRKYVEIL